MFILVPSEEYLTRGIQAGIVSSRSMYIDFGACEGLFVAVYIVAAGCGVRLYLLFEPTPRATPAAIPILAQRLSTLRQRL